MMKSKETRNNIIKGHTINPQNYTGVNFRELAQYTDSTSKTFTVWWLKSKNAMPLILFIHATFANHGHSQKTRRLNTREHFWIYGS